VPIGTVVTDEQGSVLADLAMEGQRFLAARGGRGGKGNAAFLSEKRRAPTFAELGEPGDEKWLRLELRLIADVAVIGFPNAGKSTLVSKVSAARPKVADYPFTTLEPSIGVVEVDGRRFKVCDIPGLIEGAHEGKGLGLKFLRHADRALVFLHLIDLASDRDPHDDYRVVRSELGRFREKLLNRKEVVALNKSDLASESKVREVVDGFRQQEGLEAHAISAQEETGLDQLLSLLAAEVEAAREESQSAEGFELFRTVPEERISVRSEDGAWRVRGAKVERWVAMTDMNNSEAVAHLQGRLERAGVEGALGEAGASKGDEVRIGEVTFEWWPPGTAPE
jgi:GTP-binding protein